MDDGVPEAVMSIEFRKRLCRECAHMSAFMGVEVLNLSMTLFLLQKQGMTGASCRRVFLAPSDKSALSSSTNSLMTV